MIFITYYEFLALVKCQCPAHRPYCQHLDLGLETLAPRFRSRSLVFKGPDDNAGGSRNHEGSILGRQRFPKPMLLSSVLGLGLAKVVLVILHHCSFIIPSSNARLRLIFFCKCCDNDCCLFAVKLSLLCQS